MGHILSLFIYLLTTSVSGRVPVVLPDRYPGNKLPGYGSPSHYALSFRNTCIFGVHHKYLNEDIPTKNDRKKCRRIVLVLDSRPTDYGYSRGVSRPSRGRQTTWSSITAVSSRVTF